MNLKKRIRKLKDENFELKLENIKLRIQLQELTTEWKHPRSCLHNDDPWQHIK